jgi:uncharacterized protein (TIGR02145 family)
MYRGKIVIVLFLLLLVTCGKKSNPTKSENKPPACDMTGNWNIVITVTGGNQMPSGTQFTAMLVFKQTYDGGFSGSITAEGGLTSIITGNASDVDFNFVIKQNSPCKGTFQGSGKVTESCSKVEGTYSGNDCNGSMKARFSSIGIPTPDITGTVTDIDSTTYKTVKIGNQWWMAENLKVTHYRNGDPILLVADNAEWSNLTTGAYCNYDNNEEIAAIYGCLYNQYATVDSRNLAPAGWHIPSDDEWKTLTDFLGGDAISGGKMKETGTLHWFSPNTGATDESGFTALPAGCREPNGIFDYLSVSTNFWSSSESTKYPTFTVGRSLNLMNTEVYYSAVPKQFGSSVRCVKDDAN